MVYKRALLFIGTVVLFIILAQLYLKMIPRPIHKFYFGMTSPLARSELIGVAYASHANENFCRMLISAAGNDIPVLIVGWGESTVKLAKLGAYLRVSKWLPPNAIGLYFDAFDVLFQHNASIILENYKAFNVSLVHAAEKNCYPYSAMDPICRNYPRNAEVDKLYAKTKRPTRYLNGGALIGTSSAAQRWFKDAVKNALRVGGFSDQAVTHKMFVSKKYPMQLDVYSRLFQCTHESLDEIEYVHSERRWKNNITGSNPSLLHFNGDKVPLPGMDDQMFYRGRHSWILRWKAGFYLMDNSFVPYRQVCGL